MFMSAIMRPDHPLWSEFHSRLNRVDRCRQTTEHARAILETMSGIDVAQSLNALREIGGTCDCAILYDLCADARHALA
jgi:hypothetical protein